MLKKFTKVSIVIPVYNEEKTIGLVIEKVLASNTLGLEKEIIIVDDFSTDKTKYVIQRYKKSDKISIYSNSKNIGKGGAIRRGFLKSSGDILIVQDADLEYSPTDYPVLIKPILEGYADVVYGSRFINSNPHRVLYFYHYLGNSLITTLSNLLTNLNLTDMETGYKAFAGNIIRKVAPELKSERFGFEPEITARLAKIKDIRFYEVGVSYFGRTYKEGKKINWFDGIKAIVEIFRYNLFN